MFHRVRAASVALVLGAALAACTSPDDKSQAQRSPTAPLRVVSATAPPRVTATPAGTPVAAGPSAPATPAPPAARPGDDVRGTAWFSITLPEGWRTIPLSKEQIEAVAQELGPTSPQASTLKGVIQAGQWDKLEFFAFDPKSTDYLTVVKTTLTAGATSQQVLEQMKQTLPQVLPDFTLRGSRAGFTIDGKDAALVQLDTSVTGAGGLAGMRLSSVQFYVLHGTEAAVISVSGSPRDGFDQAAERIASTFHLK